MPSIAREIEEAERPFDLDLAARQCGVFVPTACQQGVCGTCRIAKLSGEVAMDDLGGLTPERSP